VIEAALARRIRFIGLDVDGTMTDGGVYLGAAGTELVDLKRYDITDGLGVVLLRQAKLPVVILTGRASEAARLRAAELGADEYAQDPDGRKLPAFQSMLHKYHMRWEEAAFLGDDLPDLPVLQRVGLPVAVANAVPEVRAVAVHTTERPGGHGAVREFAETFLRARGQWTDVVRAYLRERGGELPR
jgi:3-deoxy-D-manno-octulosonate 8-phosphate phosphatase (KDO 8-P phosphatase)